MPEIVCPECSQVTDLVAVRRAAEEFCAQCDFPLFWAPSAAPMATPGVSSDSTMRRLPGASGRRQIGTKVCPECGELNPMKETHCGRCSSELDPKPVVVPPPVVRMALPEPEPVVEAPRRKWWFWAIAAALATIEVVIVVIVALD
jgi:ribosomal protein L40E